MPHHNSDTKPRYKPCQVLSDHKVPYAIWFEDTLHHYGVPTWKFDLYLLVSDLDKAAELLVEAGWVLDSQGPHQIGNARVELPQKRLISPTSKTITVLLPAQEWKFPLMESPDDASGTTDSHEDVAFPPLPGFLDALIESWLDCPSDDSMLLLHLACQISYLYEYAPAVKQRSFAEQMKYEHRQFHFDVLAGMQTGTIQFRKHQRAIRDALLRGQYEPPGMFGVS
ncbi:hypothetical protein N7489_002091 [Penicillium chrysogenum]|jgi:hypothetical protein|uniref:Uncharacterized protein n=1 Tax=Penicillium chrysogenum TaxID=5076 RepID=A0A167T6E3_PENCH|nr:uncharacterized protein N7525_008443 [Penicillium rubens]XP_056572148.1 uncharacterized protein N7489_002091 [Penicillium chrysogenum]KAJ5048405.1 hypothetical protein NUH16_006904 [Penicillium rubens]KAJ5251681.1 hypothetical protein N7489_002091 [Penicillium chrysogenum]KAJ5263109.1 hypothetical protein N7524_008414 [Penicillium chrysogenum]KAJ5830190.1 hypothetical protein N7525_008443 [Penicillium rubens]KZN87932.1 hypothetical protein EN45_064950 [Penicillium chrysogenum]